MFLNICFVVSLVGVFIATVRCQDIITNKYYPEDNRIIKRLHDSPDAKLFLHGCSAEPYIQLTTNDTTISNEFKLGKSKEYLFAIFTLEKVSIVFSNGANSSGAVSFDITLGIDENSMAMLEVYFEGQLIGNKTQLMVPSLPTIPYYVNVSITDNSILVYEARVNALEPFLFVHSNSTHLTSESYFVKFRHSSPIYAHYDCCEQCSPWIFTRISGCFKYSVRTANAETEMTHSLIANQSPNRTDFFLFNQNIVVNHDGNPTFGAKIIFSEFEDLRKTRYEIGLSDTPTIFHYVNSSANYLLSPGLTLKREYTWPFIVNIKITRNGVVSLRQPHEQHPFLHYEAQSTLKPVDVKYMKMVKFHEDFIRYDFYHNCTDVLSFLDPNEPINDHRFDNDNNDTDSYPIIWEYISKEFNETKFDVLHIFQDSYQIYDKSVVTAFEDSGEYDDQPASTSVLGQSTDQTNDVESKSGGISEMLKKAVAALDRLW